MSSSAGLSWLLPASAPSLGPDEVHVWRVDLDALNDRLHVLAHLLQADESARAERFRFREHRARFVACRASLRYLLASHLAIPATRVDFAYSALGKPELADSHRSDLRFNVSHSDGMALIALARGRSVGIDIERMRPDVDWMGIVAQYFSPAERAALERLQQTDRTRAFYGCWVRKEAAIKAWGKGLSLPLESISVPPDTEQARLQPPLGMTGLARLDVTSLRPRRGYAAAIAIESDACAPGRCEGFELNRVLLGAGS